MELNEQLRQKVAAYKPLPKALQPIMKAPLLLLVGVSGAGKNTVEQHLLASYPNDYIDIVTHVTRSPRPGEKEGVSYYFIDFTTANSMLDAGAYIEANIVHAEDVYGTSIAEVKRIYDAGKIAVGDVTIEGSDDYFSLGLNVKAVFLLPPSYEVWKRRLEQREDAIDNAERVRRMQSAVREISHALEAPNYYIVINDDLDDTVELVNRIGHGEPVEPHYHKAMEIAEDILLRLRAELSTLDV